MATVLHVPAFEDNYVWLVMAPHSGRAVIVDPGDADPVTEALGRHALTPAAILCTHHHDDHVGGVEELVRRHAIPVYGPATEPIPQCRHALRGGQHVDLVSALLRFDVLDVPGHTRGHIAYVGHGLLFCGDTLFSAGCGRLFEGTPDQMFASLGRLAALPEPTRVCCAHEYTAANLRFAATVEPDNPDIRQHQDRVRALRDRDEPTLPSSIGTEKRINPFLRTHLPSVRAAAERQAGRRLETPLEVFTVIRRWKDNFRG
jgi:hydroxyacylglutathione hydrolase